MVCTSSAKTLRVENGAYIWFSSRTVLRKMTGDRSVTVSSVDVQPTDNVRKRNLGVLLDRELAIKQQIKKVASACFYHMRRLRQLKRHVSQLSTSQVKTRRIGYFYRNIYVAA